jgi:hypothetical protein
MYEFGWIPGGLAPAELVDQMAQLYSQHYGVWGPGGPRLGEKIRLSAAQIHGTRKRVGGRNPVKGIK